MADNFGAVTKPYDYSDYYTPIRGRSEADKLKGNEVAPGQSVTDKLRAMFGMLGVDQTPVDMNAANASIGTKLRGGLGLAPAMQPTATQADARKSDTAIAGMGAAQMTSPTAAPAASAATVGPGATSFRTPAEEALAGIPKLEEITNPSPGVTVTPGPNGPVRHYTGAAADIERAKDIAASLAPRTAAPAGAETGLYQPVKGGFGAAYAASMNQARAAGQERAARGAALKLPEILKTQAEVAKLTELNRLAAAEPDPEKRRLILSGLQAPSSAPYTFIPGMKEGEVIAGNRQTGAATTQSARPTMTMAEATASAQRHGKTRTPAQIRSDMAAQGIILTD